VPVDSSDIKTDKSVEVRKHEGRKEKKPTVGCEAWREGRRTRASLTVRKPAALRIGAGDGGSRLM